MHAWLVVLFFFSFYSQAILSGTDVWYSSCFLFWCPSGGPLYAANRCLCLTDSWPRQRAARRPTPATCHSRHRDSDSLLWPLASLPFHFPLLFQGNNTNFSVLENLPRNHNLTLLFPNDFWFVKSIFFFPLSLTTHTFFSIFYFSKTAQTNECWVFCLKWHGNLAHVAVVLGWVLDFMEFFLEFLLC